MINFTLDWSNISSTFIYYLYWSRVNIFAAFVLGAWILVPIGAIGGAYPTALLMNPDYTLNEELYAEIGAPKMSAQPRWAYFFSYTAYLGAFVSLCLFQGPMLLKTIKSCIAITDLCHEHGELLREHLEPLSHWFILGSVNHLYIKKYKYSFWKTYAYIASAATDTGFNLNMLLIFIAFSAVKTTVAPNWWGNNANSVERCFPTVPAA
ncbi:hypothetical protein B0H13DRAFT_2541094 [Mycena leptocephala]|nr:hypothetical protein B0H13DRAFT_2541094 [Mycena leptocephala]